MRVFLNFIYLSISKGSGLILFLLITPLLISRIGIEKLGLVSVALGVVYIFDSFVEYSFNITVVQDISINRLEKTKISKIFTDTIFAKLILLSVASVIFLILLIIVTKFRVEFILYIITFIFVFGRAINPIWYFMGVEKMHFITITSLLSKISYLIFIYLFVINENDYIKVNLFFGLSEVFSSSIILVYLYFSKKIVLTNFSVINSINLIIRDYKFSTSLLLAKIYINIPIIFLGFFASPILAGIYSIADKIVANFKDIIGLFYSSVMPYFSSLFAMNNDLAIKRMWFISFSLIVLFSLLFIPINYFSTDIISFFTKDYIKEINDVFIILFASAIINSMRLPHSIFITLKRLDKYFLISAIFSAILISVACFLGIKLLNEKGAAFSVVFGEAMMLILLSYFLFKNQKTFFNIKNFTK